MQFIVCLSKKKHEIYDEIESLRTCGSGRGKYGEKLTKMNKKAIKKTTRKGGK